MLPIDAKFPQEDFQRLLEAREQADTAAADIALKQLERRLKSEARDIQNKYLCPPQTTDFAIMYLPIEGLFAEAVNLPGLLDELQRTYRVCVAGRLPWLRCSTVCKWVLNFGYRKTYW